MDATRRWSRLGALLLSLVLVLGMIGPVIGQTTHKKGSFIHRHPTMTGIAAGAAAYHMAKKTGHNRAMHGRRRNFAQRHPVLTGVAAGMAARHYAKKHQ